MSSFHTQRLPTGPDAIAPDGSQVRRLLRLPRVSLAHFELAPGQTSHAIAHRTVEEIWYVLSGQGEMWRQLNHREAITPLEAGVAITLPVGTRFQFRSVGPAPLAAIGITMPPWPGAGEAYAVPGKWPASGSALEVHPGPPADSTRHST